ncbi:MAG: hypothetical protein ABEI77_02725 [Halorientalis sp.]
MRLFGSATAVGALSGLAVGGTTNDGGGHDGRTGDQTQTPPQVRRRLRAFRDALDLHGLTLTADHLSIDTLRVTPPSDGGEMEAVAVQGLEFTIENDSLTATNVDDVAMAQQVEDDLSQLVEHLAAGDLPADLDNLPGWLRRSLTALDDRQVAQLGRDIERHDGPANALAYYLGHGGKMDGLYVLAALWLVVLTAVVVLFQIL